MKNIFATKITIEEVRHLKSIEIDLSETERRHLIFTGKNGSGKTSALNALASNLNTTATSDKLNSLPRELRQHINKLERLREQSAESNSVLQEERYVKRYTDELNELKSGVNIDFNESAENIRYSYEKGQFIIAYYKAERVFKANTSNHVEKVDLKDKYSIMEMPKRDFVKYLTDLKVTEALARNGGKEQKAEGIKEWFDKFENLLRRIFEDKSLTLIFDEDAFTFHIKEDNRELFDFNTLSSGFSAVLDIVLDIIMRMEKATNRSFDYNIPGIVLIDEIETHLHLELQKTVLELLTTLFPNVQFIVSTHSPFVLNSLDNVVIYDLENHTKVDNGLSNIPYEGVVEGYFKADVMSKTLREKYQRYKELVAKEELTDDDFEEIADLEVYLDEIPDYLALDITTEYQRLKAELGKREDI